jgi:2-methylcitrate dehydratase PrpD
MHSTRALAEYVCDLLERPDIAEIADKVELRLGPALDARFPAESLCRVVVVSSRGRYESPVTAPRGEPGDPMSWQDLREKFLMATRNVMRARQQQSVLEAVDRLAEGDLDPLMLLLGGTIAEGAPVR